VFGPVFYWFFSGECCEMATTKTAETETVPTINVAALLRQMAANGNCSAEQTEAMIAAFNKPSCVGSVELLTIKMPNPVDDSDPAQGTYPAQLSVKGSATGKAQWLNEVQVRALVDDLDKLKELHAKMVELNAAIKIPAKRRKRS
jgi:hypothetical protein